MTKSIADNKVVYIWKHKDASQIDMCGYSFLRIIVILKIFYKKSNKKD